MGVIRRQKGLPYRLDQTALNIGPKVSVQKTSADLGWSSINVSLIVEEPKEDVHAFKVVPALWIAMNHVPTEIVVRTARRKWDLKAPPGQVHIVAPETSVETIRRNEDTVLHAFVKRTVLAEVANELFDRDVKSLEIVTDCGVEDLGLALLLQSLERALFEPPGYADLKVEYLARALAAHVLHKNTNLIAGTESAANVPLTNRQVRLVINYIQDHLSSKIVLNDLATLLNLGQTSLTKRFKASFRQTPHQYLMEVRVSRARELLERSNLPVVEVAVLCGFADQTHLGTVFKGIVGMTPSQYRRFTQ